MKTHKRLLIALFAALILAGCNAGDGEGLDNNGQPIDPNQPETPVDPPVEPPPEQPGQPTPPDDGSIRPTLASIQEKVFTPICVQCHAGGNAPLGLGLDDLETSQSNLIDIDSATNPTFKRVLPGDADNSFLYLKISGAPIAGNQMPLGLAPLDQETQDTIKQWINDGAPIDATQVTAAVKIDRTVAKQITARISFSQAIQKSSFDVASALLVNPLNGATVVSNTTFSWLDEKTLNVQFSGLENMPSALNLILNQPSLSSITSESGYVLDGDMDGYQGGALVHEISL
ncbi:hypothetical protein PN836_007050 [Ningiella sp. W23]|uniref:hypothetical protein n=1 Tax=Ningiella sp. W23 TaxID=3023715 RepID=UPI003757996E